ncbi:hypothetical protein [Rhodobacter ferrooxidans]|uniref:Uncharacterized protein n=1 Tax=Rhodobacter ferrooxidans TaxID=371731 RepID=C8S3B9_9RHOB|nr:hypothetical protein [Rhodobacter sp. SW2]EEW24484.1 conserved hypothetical protein [Rhodobacter sp. SW2]
MRALALAASLALVAPSLAAADTALSAEVGAKGLAPTIARLETLASPTDVDRFALGGLRFLRVVEGTLQTRWKVGLTNSMQMLPFLRLPIPENPTPAAFDPAVVAQVFRDAATGLDAARAPLAEIPAGSDFGLEISLADIWFDINADGARDSNESLMNVAGPMIMGWQWSERDPATPAPVIRFDAADAAWLSAYTHLLGGVSEVVLAYDPTAAITKATTASAALYDLNDVHMAPDDFNRQFGEFADIIAMVLGALNQTPDAARATSAHGHFLAMIGDNRDFWTRVALETDNDREWLPNDKQQSALGVTVPPGTAQVWQGVLADAEGLLTGKVLAPYWRLDDSAGVNVGAMFTKPAAIDLIGWIQGADALPYLEKGKLVSGANWNAFAQLVSGEAMLFTLYLN